jgi:opacity protein-like surface antigen
MKKLLAAAFLAFFALPAAAQVAGSGAYLGGGLGQAHFSNVCGGAVFECKDRDTAWNLFAGWQLMRYLGVEAGIGEFGHVTIDGQNAKANAIELDAVGTLPLFSRFSLIGRVGAFHADMHAEGAADRKNGGTAGLGIEWAPDPMVGIRLEWQRYPGLGGDLPGGTKTNIDVTRLAALIRFR